MDAAEFGEDDTPFVNNISGALCDPIDDWFDYQIGGQEDSYKLVQSKVIS